MGLNDIGKYSQGIWREIHASGVCGIKEEGRIPESLLGSLLADFANLDLNSEWRGLLRMGVSRFKLTC